MSVNMYERILVALDGSNAAEIVLPYAVEIAAKLGAENTLVSVSGFPATDTDHLYQAYLEGIKGQVRREVKDFGAKEEPKVFSKILVGKPASEILRYADEINAGLIVMASRGSSSPGTWLLGNVADKVLRATVRPVLLIRAPASPAALQRKRLIQRILVPLDGSQVGQAVIPNAEALGRVLDAELVLFQALQPSRTWVRVDDGISHTVLQIEKSVKACAVSHLHEIAEALSKRGLRTSSVVVLGSAADEIIDYAKENAIDLIAMSTHGRSGIRRWVFGSVADKVLHAGDTAILVVSAAKAAQTI